MYLNSSFSLQISNLVLKLPRSRQWTQSSSVNSAVALQTCIGVRGGDALCDVELTCHWTDFVCLYLAWDIR